MKEIRNAMTDVRATAEVKGDKRFFRLHKPFHDAVRTGKVSAVVNVLLRADLSGDQARRTAEKILANRDLYR
jgi:hypothetical protein